MITVWHRNHDDDRKKRIDLLNQLDRVAYGKSKTLPSFDLNDYTKVAIVDTDDAEEAYAVVQNEGKDWQGDWQNHPLVLWGAPPPQRAHTDPGDLLQCPTHWRVVLAIGTKPIDDLLLEGRVFLDPTGKRELPKSSCIVIDSEVEWMRSFLVGGSLTYWVKGRKVCELAKGLLCARQLEHLIQPLNEQGDFTS